MERELQPSVPDGKERTRSRYQEGPNNCQHRKKAAHCLVILDLYLEKSKGVL